MNTNFKDDFVEYKCLCCKKNYQQKFDEKSKEQFFNTYNFLTRTTISLFCFWEKVFTLMNTSLIWKKKEKIRKIMFIQIMRTQKEFLKIKRLGRYDVYVQSTTL